MYHVINKKRLFYACSLALVVTAMTFSIRANLLGTLGDHFALPPKEMGEIAAAAFWGFTIAMFTGGPLCDLIGLKRLYLLAFLTHLSGIILTVFATGYWSLYCSTLLVGIGNGCIESASYTMVSSMYTNDKAKKINDWHIWFPGGIVIGGLIAYFMSLANAGWQLQMAIMILPTIGYGYMFYGQQFPVSERIHLKISNRDMIRECGRPLFLFMLACMLLTAATELGTNQWIAALLANIGIPSILLLVFINGIMAIGRANAGTILKRFSATGVLLLSSVLSFAGLLWLGYATGYTSFVAAGVFAAGICFFWPTMIGFVAENLYKTGPLGLSLMGGTGLLSTALVLPYMGALYEAQLATASATQAGANTLKYVAVLPAMLIIAFGLLHLYIRRRKRSTTAAVPVLQ